MTPTVVLLAAGMSTRYGRLKQLEPVGPDGETLLDYAIFDARRAGFSRILLIIREELEAPLLAHRESRWPRELEVAFHHQKVDDLPGFPAFSGDHAGSREAGWGGGPSENAALRMLVESRTKPWGTAHALLTARPHLPGPFVVLNADDFYGVEAFHQAAEFFQGVEVPAVGKAEPGRGTTGEGPGPKDRPPTFGLVTYTLVDTLSDHGGVSRGICELDAQGWLRGVQEVLEIRREDDGLRGRTVSGRERILRGSEPISTNFWLFTPDVFPIFEAGFADFITELRYAGSGESEGPPSREEFRPSGTPFGPTALDLAPPQPEFLIPPVVNGALEAGKATIRGFPTRGRFLGITHPEDRERVVSGLEEMTREGCYPRPLWK